MDTVYRMQDRSGRGPYRPGSTVRWADWDHDDRNRSFWEEFGPEAQWLNVPRDGMVMGAGFRSVEQAFRWFHPTERRRLFILGYRMVRIQVDRIVAESPNQLLFLRRKPLREV